MAKNFSGRARSIINRLVGPLSQTLVRAGVSPDVVTIAGTAGVVIGAVGFATRGKVLVALLIVLVSVCTDMLDGAMARAQGRTSKFGAFLDSTMDRVADGAIFGSVAYWLAVTDHRIPAAVALVCVVAGQIISYAKARAEGLGMTANVGIAERPERLVIIGIGGMLHVLGVPTGLYISLWVLAALSVITVVQRMVTVYQQAAAQDTAVNGPRAGDGVTGTPVGDSVTSPPASDSVTSPPAGDSVTSPPAGGAGEPGR